MIRKVICYRCENEINAINESSEHIIPNACGGRLKSNKLLCNKCNSEFGKGFDSVLARSTNDIANLLHIKRERGIPQPILSKRKSTGEEYYLNYDGSPTQTKPKFDFFPNENGETMLHIRGNNSKEVFHMIARLKRMHPNLNDENLIAAMKEEEVYIDDSFTINSHIGGTEEFKAITKTAINFFIYNGGDRKYIKHLLPYLENKEKADVVWMHYPSDMIYKPIGDEVTHVIKVVGDKDQRVLYAYVELFNLHNFIIRLNQEYDGPSIDFNYVFDVHTYQNKTDEITLKLSRNDLDELFKNKDSKPFDNVSKRYERILQIIDKKQDQYQLRRIISDSVDQTIGNLPTGTIVDEKILEEFRQVFFKKLTLFLAHRSKQG